MLRRLAPVLVPLALVAAAVLSGERDARSAPSPAGPSGLVRMVDGDTLDLGGTRVRLFGIDAPEGGQACLDARGASWDCGAAAARAARGWWEGRTATCAAEDTDRYGRTVAACEVAGEDMGRRLVREGLAVAYLAFSDRYAADEAAARAARAGVWAGEFQKPWDWRAAQRAGDGAAGACAIKGNVSEAGRIYHLPGSPSYAATRIREERGERWFCSVAEAEAAGWRAARD